MFIEGLIYCLTRQTVSITVTASLWKVLDKPIAATYINVVHSLTLTPIFLAKTLVFYVAECLSYFYILVFVMIIDLI